MHVGESFNWIVSSGKKPLQIMFIPFIVYLATLASASGECPARYLRFDKNPAYCETTAPDCRLLKTGVSDDQIKEALHELNSFRNEIASGKVKGNHGYPEAANMMQLEWDDQLAMAAQRHSESCDYRLNNASQIRVADYVLNDQVILHLKGKMNIKRIVHGLRLSIKTLADARNSPFYKDRHSLNPSEQALRAVLEGVSWTVGVGWAMYDRLSKLKGFYTINVGQHYGRHSNKTWYIPGKAASRCPHNTKPSTKYPALCKSLTKFGPTDIDIPEVRKSPDTIFFCDFSESSLCELRFSHSDENGVSIVETESYNYLSILVRAGDIAKIIFPVNLEACVEVCLNVDYAHGQTYYSSPTKFSTITVKHAVGQEKLKKRGKGYVWGFGKMIIELEEGRAMEWIIKSPPYLAPGEFFEVRRIIISEDLSLCE